MAEKPFFFGQVSGFDIYKRSACSQTYSKKADLTFEIFICIVPKTMITLYWSFVQFVDGL